MTVEPGSIEHLSQVISHVVAPAFLFTAVAGFASLLTDRLALVAARLKHLSGIQKTGTLSGDEMRDLAQLRKRAVTLNVAVLFSVASGASALIMIITGFTAALLSITHVWVAAVLFIASTFLLLCSLAAFTLDLRAALRAEDLH